MLKKELEKGIDRLREEDSAKQSLIYEYRDSTTELEQEVSKLKAKNSQIDFIIKERNRLLQTIVVICAGDAKLESKAEVITDLLSDKVDKIKEIKKPINQSYHHYDEYDF